MDDEEFESLPTAERQRIMGMLQENPLAEPDEEPTTIELTELQKKGAELYHYINEKYGLEGTIDWMS